MSPNSLIIHPTYTNIIIALASSRSVLDKITIGKHEASRDIINSIDILLKRANLNLLNLDFLAAHQGPGPFTTLRVALASINGLSYATKLPLIGIDGLNAFVYQEKPLISTPILAVVLNAFCDDVYFAIYNRDQDILEKGCQSIEKFIISLKKYSKQGITCLGNAVLMHKEFLGSIDNLKIPDPIPEICSVESIHTLAYNYWLKKETQDQLLPHYLKNFSIQNNKV